MDKGKIAEKMCVVKKRRKALTLSHKLEVIRRHERGDRKAKIGRDLGINESTVRAILKKRDDYKEKGKVASTSAMQMTRNRSRTMIEMENILSLWIEDRNEKGIPLNTMDIKMKALSIFDSLKENLTKENESPATSEETFTASSGWFVKFKNRTRIHHVYIKSEAVSADSSTPEKYSSVFKETSKEYGYNNKQIFNVDETGLFWFKTPLKTFLMKKKRQQPELPFDEVHNTGVPDVLETHSKGLSNEDLLNLDQQRADRESNNLQVCGNVSQVCGNVSQACGNVSQVCGNVSQVCGNVSQVCGNVSQMKEIALEEFDTIFHEFEKFKQLIMDIDPNIKRSMQVQRNLDKELRCYRQMYADKQKENDEHGIQMTLDKYFPKK